METIRSISEKTKNDRIFIVCQYYNNGYIKWTPYKSKEQALMHSYDGQPDWSIVQYNRKSKKHSLVHAEGRTFPVNVLCCPDDYDGFEPVIISVPHWDLPSLIAHYEESGPIYDHVNSPIKVTHL